MGNNLWNPEEAMKEDKNCKEINSIQIGPKLNKLIIKAIECEKDANKFDQWNVLAGKRLRREMQKIRKLAKEIRAEIQKKRLMIQNKRKRMKNVKPIKIHKRN